MTSDTIVRGTVPAAGDVHHSMSARYLDPFLETLGRDALRQIQLKKLQMMLGPVLESNAFYRQKLGAAGLTSPEDVATFDDLRRIPFTTKAELSLDQAGRPPYGTNLTFPLQHYTRIHHTSGTTGEPLKCLDTDESWAWWARNWGTVYRAAGVTPLDRVFFAFSFGPFIGFWSAYEGARIVGALAIPGGGMSSAQRVRAILTHDVSVLVCTPTYALHMADVAAQEGLDLAASNVRTTIHAGEPGASIPSTKRRIEESWGARCFDHAGATEVGAWGFECQAQSGLHVNEGEFIFECVDPVSGAPADEGELIMTNLGRTGMPVIRYRTGDRVRVTEAPCDCGRTYRRLAGGIIGRVDDVLIVRGVNVFPSVIEDFVRRFPEINEFAVDVFRRDELDEIEIRIETQSPEAETIASAVAREIRNGLSIRPLVRAVPYGTLPRFDLKARRIKDHRR
jgi:phenylacetate-CoA ligase